MVKRVREFREVKWVRTWGLGLRGQMRAIRVKGL